jgi:hypothetical protein
MSRAQHILNYGSVRFFTGGLNELRIQEACRVNKNCIVITLFLLFSLDMVRCRLQRPILRTLDSGEDALD